MKHVSAKQLAIDWDRPAPAPADRVLLAGKRYDGADMEAVFRRAASMPVPPPLVSANELAALAMKAHRAAAAFVVHGKPQPKQRARKGKNGRWYTPTPTRNYEALVRDVASLYLGAHWRKDGVFRLEVRIVVNDHRPFDSDNVLKAVSDAMNGVAYDDDRQVTETATSKHYEPGGRPRIEVRLERLGDAPEKVKRKTRRKVAGT